MSLEQVQLDDQLMARAAVSFGRNRFLGVLGAALFGLVVRAVAQPPLVEAHHAEPSGNCYAYHDCACCSGSNCCDPDCGYPYYLGCPGGGQCWLTSSSCIVTRCCDYTSRSDPRYEHNCICSATWSEC